MPATRWPTREKLYEQVWSRPAETVAADLGVTGSALSRMCGRLDVPKPPRGYWARVQEGQTPRRATLPRKARTRSRSVSVTPPFTPPPLQADLPEPEVVAATRRAYAAAATDLWGRLTPPCTGAALDLMVSEATLPRALQVMTLLVQGLRSQGGA